MGYIQFSIPKALVLEILEHVPIENFIETGTFKGDTSIWACKHFSNVYTIEIDLEMAKSTAASARAIKNIKFLTGDSRKVLPELLANIKGRSFFWLDGHWCAGGGGKESECPLLDEIKAIHGCPEPIIFIDDARCFLGPLPEPHRSTDWPAIDDIFALLRELFPKNYCTIQDDVVMCVPPDVKEIIDTHWKKSFFKRFSGFNKAEKDERHINKTYLIALEQLKKVYRYCKYKLLKKVVSKIGHAEEAYFPADLPDWNYTELTCVFDVGAHLGKFTRKITSNNANAVVHLFEPNRELITTLRENFKMQKVIINEVALSNVSGVNIFHHNKFDETNSLLEPAQVSPDIDSLTENEFESQVETQTLDEYANSKHINHIDLLKIDAQGLGYEVLEGAHLMLSRKAIDKIWVEAEFTALYKNQKLFRDIDNFLQQYGYVLHNLYNLKFAGKNLGWCDAYYQLDNQ